MSQRILTSVADATLKQRLWLKAYLETKNATEAAMRVYKVKNRETAANIGWENVRKLDFSDLMEEGGTTDGLLLQKLDEGLNATKQIGARKIVQGARGAHEIKVDATTDVDDFIEVEDYAVRHKYLETALKLKKRLIDRKDQENGNTNNFTFHFGDGFVPPRRDATAAPVGGNAEAPTEVQGVSMAPQSTKDDHGPNGDGQTSPL